MFNFAKKHLLLLMIVAPMAVFAAQAPNQRAGNVAARQGAQNSGGTATATGRATTSRSAVNNRGRATVDRSATTTKQARATTNAVKPRSATAAPTAGTKVNATGTARSARVAQRPNANRSDANQARATAVFSDVSKIGGGYTDCHDSFATCMDQFCANADDMYGRCFCSDRFSGLRDNFDNLSKALSMLNEFQNTNLDVVDKTAAEVNAMYTASEGEAAIKRDTSASQKLLDSIDKLLSGKKETTSSRKPSTNSLGVLDLSSLSNSISSDNIWSGGGSSVFGGRSSSYADLSEMEGKELYTNAQQQCAEITSSSCPSDAMFNLARSAYSILITQKCNDFEKKINEKKASIQETVRTAEKYLREARLEEYRAHNSADVNACLSLVESALRAPTACGENYNKCLDYTGKYINLETGDPIYSKALFELNSLIVLNGSSTDILSANKSFNNFLEEKKKFAVTALDSCRDIADTVWTEFKRTALIRISQAQDTKIQQVKDSCVATIRECYNKQTGDLKDLASTTFSTTGAISAVAARGMCYDRVMACAALYGDPDGCKYNDKTKKIEKANNGTCGLQSLLAYVDAVDAVRVAEGCEVSLQKYAHELCDPDISEEDDEEITDNVYPMGCKDMSRQELRAAMEERARLFCAVDLMQNDQSNTIGDSSAFNAEVVNRVVKDIFDELFLAFSSGCEYTNGTWVTYQPNKSELNMEFYRKYYGVEPSSSNEALGLVARNCEDGYCTGSDKGWCVVNTDVKARCLELGDLAHYDEATNDCVLSDGWYSKRCEELNGTYSNSMCTITDMATVENFLK